MPSRTQKSSPLVNAIEVSVDGDVIGIYVPPEGESFAAMVGNIPMTYMRAQVLSGHERESWQWQLPDIKIGQTISFRMVRARVGTGVPPQFVRRRTQREIDESRREGKRLYAKAMRAAKSALKPSARKRPGTE